MRRSDIDSHTSNTCLKSKETECKCTPFPDAAGHQPFEQHQAQHFFCGGEGAGSVLPQCYTFSSNFTSCSPDRSCIVLALLLS